MRIITWNCYRGECFARAARLAHLQPDITVLQECGRPTRPTDGQCVWFGSNPRQGVAAVASGGWRVEAAPLHAGVSDSVYPIEVIGPEAFHMLAIWAKPRPTYVRAVLSALDCYHEFVRSAPTVILGDFNSNACWDTSSRNANHSAMVSRLRSEFGVVSAFHAKAPGCPEPPTIYWQWKRHQPFHIDYCFLPLQWVRHIQAVEVGGYEEWATESDHRPVIVDLALP